jgi:amino-acid N-acetyltransferase
MAAAAPLIRDMVRIYVRAQRKQAKCGDGASTVQCHVLTELLREEGVSQQVLVERLGLDKGWISRAVDALVSEGSIRKQTSAQDRRSVVLSLTATGRARAEQLDDEVNRHAIALLDRVPRDRQAQVHESLQLLINAMSTSPSCPAEDSTLTVRPACSKDWAAIKRMLLAERLPLDGAREHLPHFMVGEVGGMLRCAGGLELYGTDALLRSLVVDAASRGNGWAQRIVQSLMQRASEHGVTNVYLLTTSAEGYFSRLGFVAVVRDCIPAAVARSRQFQAACPAGAVAMTLPIAPPSLNGPGLHR